MDRAAIQDRSARHRASTEPVATASGSPKLLVPARDVVSLGHCRPTPSHENIVHALIDRRRFRITESARRRGDDVQDSVEVGWRGRDHAQHLSRGRLLLQHLGERSIAVLDLDGVALTKQTQLSLKLLDRHDVVSHHVLPDRRFAQAANMRLAGHSDGVAPA
jgi:hypothetical protein